MRLSQTRKRYPFSQSILRTATSGSVSRECIADIIFDRFFLLTVSMRQLYHIEPTRESLFAQLEIY